MKLPKQALLGALLLALILILPGCASSKRRDSTPPPIEKKQAALKELDTRTLIVIDAGHGGEDLGALSAGKPALQEKQLTLATAKMVERYLQTMGYRTYMMRQDDTFIPLKERAKISDSKFPALFVSVHYNSAPSKQAHGIEVFYYKTDKDLSRCHHSKRCAELVLNEVVKQTKARSRGVKHGNFAVIRETNTPAILIEGGFITNQDELKKISDPQYMQRLAFGIAKGITQYFQHQ